MNRLEIASKVETCFQKTFSLYQEKDFINQYLRDAANEKGKISFEELAASVFGLSVQFNKDFIYSLLLEFFEDPQ